MSEQSSISLKRIVYSTLTLIVAFILTKLLLEAMIYSVCRTLGYLPSFSFSSVHGADYYRQWSRSRVVVVDLLPPLICLLLGAGLYQLMRKQTRSWGLVQFFGYWCMVCLVNTFFAQLLFAPLGVDDASSSFYQTIAVVEAWFHLPVSIASAVAVVSILLSATAGYYLSVQTVKLSHSQRLVSDNSGKNTIILQLYLLPLLLASVPLLLLGRGFYTLPVAATIFNLALLPAGMFIRNWRSPYRVRFQKTEVSKGFIFTALSVSVLLWMTVYVFLR